MADIAKSTEADVAHRFNTGKACRRGVFYCRLTSDSVIHRESKKGATLTMAITLSILGGFAKFFPCCKEQ